MPPLSPFNQIPSLGKWLATNTEIRNLELAHEVNAQIIDVMRRAGDIMAPHKLTMVMEPLNTRTNHPGVYMRTIAQGYAVARGVNSPAVKI